MQKPAVTILSLPISQWQKYKSLRLEALKEDPLAFGDTYANALEKANEEWIERVTEAEEGMTGLLLFAECNGQLVGMIGAYFNKTPDTQKKAYIVGMYVNKNYRGKGIARLLMQNILEKLKTIPDIDSVKLMVNIDQTPAFKLYESLGFKIIGTDNLTFGDGQQHEAYLMEKELE